MIWAIFDIKQNHRKLVSYYGISIQEYVEKINKVRHENMELHMAPAGNGSLWKKHIKEGNYTPQGAKSLINQSKLVRKTDSPGRLITKNKRERQTDILFLARSFFTLIPRSWKKFDTHFKE